MATDFQESARIGWLRLPHEGSRLNERQNGITGIFKDIGLTFVNRGPIQLVFCEQLGDHGLTQFLAGAFDLSRNG
jgi:hypothetical protein